MPQGKTAVLDLTAGVSEADYVRAMNALKDQMDSYRESQGWCTEFWSYITSTISPLFTYDGYNEVVRVDTTSGVTSDADRAATLTAIRGRILAYVGERITLPRANDVVRGSGLAEYAVDSAGKPWRINFPGFTVNVNQDEDPTGAFRVKFREFLAGIDDPSSEYHAGRMYVSELSDYNGYRVPVADTVPLLNR